MNYQEEIEILLQDVEIKNYYEENSYIKKLPNLYVVYMLLKKYQTYLQQQQQEQEQEQRKEAFIQRLKEREKEREEKRKEQEQRELQAMQAIQATPEPPPPDESKDQLLFIHNARAWQLLKEPIKQGVFIDKILVIITHEFLLYERQEINISLEKLCNYLSLNYKKATVNYIRKETKNITDFLINREFVNGMVIKNNVLKINLSTLFIKESKENRIITRINKTLLSLNSNQYKTKRCQAFFESNFNIKKDELNISIIYPYIIDSNISRKRKKIAKFTT